MQTKAVIISVFATLLAALLFLTSAYAVDNFMRSDVYTANEYEDMTDFLTCVVENMPATMKLNSIDGEFTTAGVYSYSFSFSSSERSTIAKFLQDLQNEEILKFVNVSAITLTGGETSAEDTDQTVTQGSDGLWDFTLVVKTKGGAQ